ncbi:hypothetical protein [uncultured Kordia sp.]|uniref:hypothetical protein n=1 Tax=uncultured Kordia sp. TaxID=507699 RepID=UPI002637241F|nr:hypothetical protein [uncultured Kordia sp.]
MKKKNLKGLALTKYHISNLTLLHRKNGGNVDNNTTGLATTTPNIGASVYPECTIPNATTVTDCATSNLVDCECNTNTGTTKAHPPTEHQECPTNNNIHFN